MAPLLSGPPQVLFYSKREVRREDFAHLHVTRSVESLAYLPLVENEQLIGAIEMINFSAALQRKDLKKLIPILQLAPAAILAGESFESQRQNLLDSVHRMTQLYDLEKSLNATLELDAVIEMIPMKVAGMLSCQAIHLWLFRRPCAPPDVQQRRGCHCPAAHDAGRRRRVCRGHGGRRRAAADCRSRR